MYYALLILNPKRGGKSKIMIESLRFLGDLDQNLGLFSGLGSHTFSLKTISTLLISFFVYLFCFKTNASRYSCILPLSHYFIRWPSSNSSKDTKFLWNITIVLCGKMELTNLWELNTSLNRTVGVFPLIVSLNAFIIQCDIFLTNLYGIFPWYGYYVRGYK